MKWNFFLDKCCFKKTWIRYWCSVRLDCVQLWVFSCFWTQTRLLLNHVIFKSIWICLLIFLPHQLHLWFKWHFLWCQYLWNPGDKNIICTKINAPGLDKVSRVSHISAWTVASHSESFTGSDTSFSSAEWMEMNLRYSVTLKAAWTA